MTQTVVRRNNPGMDARVLTVRQPWADAIIHGGKDVENRSWTTGYRGRLWIHAGLGVDRWAGLDFDETARGVLVGHVRLVDVVDDSDSEWAEPGCFHWLLADPTPCRPRPYPGGLGLRRYQPRARAAC